MAPGAGVGGGNGSPVLLMIGDGGDAEWLRQEVRTELGSGRIVWVDRYVSERAEMYGYLQAGDLYVFPSRHEGFAVAPLEAMACGLPLVAGQANGVSDILELGPEHGGIQVGAEDPAGLARVILSLCGDPARMRALGRAARRRVEDEFSVHAVGARFGRWFRDRGFPCEASMEADAR
jgi:glycosyltransferase involved in cell wall biosynthesis